MTPTSVKMPGGEFCKGGTCKKVSQILRAKPNSKKRYSIDKKKNSPKPPETDDDYVKKEEPKILLSITKHSYGEPEEKLYDGEDTPAARKKFGTKTVK